MRRSEAWLCAAAGAALLGAVAAQDEPPAAPPAPSGVQVPTIRIEGAGRPKIPIAIPEFAAAGAAGRTRELAATLRDIVRDDLEFSGYFQIIPEEYHALVRGGDGRRIPFKEWVGVGADSLVLGEAALDGAALLLTGRVFDTGDQKTVVHKRYRAESDQQRLAAHKLSNEIVLQYTGQQGLALTRIVYVGNVGKAREIFVMDYDGARVKRVTGNGSINLSPAWSPDGREIAFMSYRSGRPELMIVNSDGELRKAFPQQQGELNSAPAWSPDGRLLAFSSSRDGNAEIYTLRVADGTLTRLTHNEAIDTSPTWNPSGREIAFTSDRSGSPQIYIMDAVGANVRRLSFEVSYCDAAAWSPLGDRIAFAARVPGGFDIFVKELETGRLLKLTENANINEWPRWSPDGRHLVFASNRTGSFDVYTMAGDGSRLRRLTQGGSSFSPSWSR